MLGKLISIRPMIKKRKITELQISYEHLPEIDNRSIVISAEIVDLKQLGLRHHYLKDTHSLRLP